MTKQERDAAWEAACADVRAGIGMGVEIGVARLKGKTAAQSKIEFFTEIARVAFDAGCSIGEAAGLAKGGS